MRQRPSRKNGRHTRPTRGNAMRSFARTAAARAIVRAGFVASIAALSVSFVVAAVIVLASPADAASISGTVTGPDGAPLRAAFVQARHGKLKMTVSVLTDKAGRYVVENLPAGDYRLSVRALGTRSEPKSGITLAADGSAAHDFALQTAPVRWSDLTILQGLQLLPEARGKQTLFDNCLSCHGFQSKMAAVTTRRGRLAHPRRVHARGHALLARRPRRLQRRPGRRGRVLSHPRVRRGLGAAEVADRAARPTRTPRRSSADEALNIVYVDFEMPGPNRFPWTAHPDPDGQFLDPAIRGVEPDRALQSGERRDQGVSRAASGPGADPFGGAGARRLGVAHRGRRQEARALGPGDARRSANSRTTGASTPSRCIPTARSGRPAGSPASIRRRRSIPTSPRCRPPTASRWTRRARSGSPR